MRSEGERAWDELFLDELVDSPCIWTTRDGQEIPYDELTDRHLKNIIRMLNRAAWQMATGPYPNGEMAQDAFDSALNELEATIDDLLVEADRRGTSRGELLGE